MHPRWLLVAWLLGILALPSSLLAADFFTENFSDNSAAPFMGLGTGFGAPTTTFTGAFNITSGVNNRIYLGTSATDYGTTDFTYEATVTVPNTTNPWTIPFFGMGNRNAVAAASGEPVTIPHIGLNLRNDNGNLTLGDNGASTFANVFATGIPGIANNTHRFRMSWNAAAQQAVIGVDIGNTGQGFNSIVVNGADNGFTAANSRLFLGGGNGLQFDNIAVTAGQTKPTAILFDINSGTSPTATGATFAASGVTGDLSNALVVSAPGSTNSSMTAGGVTLSYVAGAAHQVGNVASTSFQVNPLLNDYLTFNTTGQAGPATLQISGLADGVGFDLDPEYHYELYLFGTAGTAANQNSTFTFNGESLTTGVPTGVGDAFLSAVVFDFQTGSVVSNTLNFDWARVAAGNQFGAFNGFAIVQGQMAPEPATWAMWLLLFGVGLACFRVFRSKRTAVRGEQP